MEDRKMEAQAGRQTTVSCQQPTTLRALYCTIG